MTRLLVVEDDDALRTGLTRVLRGQGYEVDVAERGDDGLRQALDHPHALVVLDVGLPGLDGFEVLRQLRESGRTTPVIMLTARGQEVDRVLGFQLGVDDYVTKPFSVLELLGRIGAVLRRAAPAETSTRQLCFGDVVIDLTAYTVQGSPVASLPKRAFDVLGVLAALQGQAVSRDTILDRVWGVEDFPTERTLNNLIVKIRHAIEPDPETPRYLKTVHGLGYRLDLA